MGSGLPCRRRRDVAIRRPITRAGDVYRIRLNDAARETLRTLCGELRRLLVNENPASDSAVARLFPPAYPEDPLRNLDYERGAGNDLLAGRLAALDTVTDTLDASRLTEEQLLAWLGAINDLRLVLGTRLDVSEDTTEETFAADERAGPIYEQYTFLTWLEDLIVDALGEPAGVESSSATD
jgi:hypothetical protein